MKLRSQRREDPEVNLTPLIDVVFLLLIFFMISTTFQREAQLQVELPEAAEEPSEAPPETLEVTIRKDGTIFLNEQQVVNNKSETIKKALQKLMDGRTDIPLIIRADSDSALQYAVTVMDVARQLQIEQLSLATTRSDGGE